MVYHKGNQHTNNFHKIEYNHFGPRPRKGGPRGETFRLGGSETSMTPGRAIISNNFFDRCNGEVEIISDKTNYNRFLNNIFYKCEGSLVMRHSDYTTGMVIYLLEMTTLIFMAEFVWSIVAIGSPITIFTRLKEKNLEAR